MGEVLALRNTVSSFSPNNLSGLITWLKADTNVGVIPGGNNVNFWGDNSNSINNFILGGGTGYPVLLQGRGPLSNSPVIFFNNNNYFKNATINLNTYTVMHVSRLYTDPDGEGRIFSSMNTNVLIGSWNDFYDRMYANGWIYQGSSTPIGFSNTDWKITVGTVDLNNYKSSFRQNGQNLISDVNSAAPLDGVSLGAWEYLGTVYERCRCEIAEVLIFNRVLTPKEIRRVEDYLNSRYSIYSQPEEIFSSMYTRRSNSNRIEKGELLAIKGAGLILEDIIPTRDFVLGTMHVDIPNGYRTVLTLDGSDRVVRNEVLSSNNRINYNLGFMPETFTAIFDYKAGGGSGADGGYFYFFSGGSAPTTGPNGKYMGGGLSGADPNSYRVHFDEYVAENQQLAVSWNGYFTIPGGTSNGTGGVLIGTAGPGNSLGFSFGDNTWRTIKVQFNQGLFNIYVNDILRLTCTDSNYNIRNKTNFNFGLGGYVGGATNFHSFKNFKLYGKII